MIDAGCLRVSACVQGYQILKDGRLYGSLIPSDVSSLRIRDVALGSHVELQLLALTDHPVGRRPARTDEEADSGVATSLSTDDKGDASRIRNQESGMFY